MDDPLFGIQYDPAVAQFDVAPSYVADRCGLQYMKTLWIYARHTTAEADYLVLSGLLVVHPDGPPGETTYIQPSDSGIVVALHADRCEQGTPGWSMHGKVVQTSRFKTVNLPLDVRKSLANDAVNRYSKAFGGTGKFLGLIGYPNLNELDLPAALKEAIEAAAKSVTK